MNFTLKKNGSPKKEKKQKRNFLYFPLHSDHNRILIHPMIAPIAFARKSTQSAVRLLKMKP